MITANNTIDYQIVSEELNKSGLTDLSKASIREIVRLINNIEKRTGQKYVRMEMGVPGLVPSSIGTNAEISALKKGVAAKYPMIDGIQPLKNELSRFIKLFLDIEVNPAHCFPTVGSMQGALAVFMVANRTDHTKEGTLFIDPGFPVQKQQVKVLGQDYYSFDVYDYRGEKLRPKLESYLKTGKISTILYSNPNNPSWICFTETELQIIGELATQYDAIVVEDLAYFGMDFRKNYWIPGKAPYQPTVAKYTDNYIFLISGSKAFSYAGQRVGTIAISDKLYKRNYPDLRRYFNANEFGYAMLFGALYALSSGVAHSAQYGLAAMLKAANDGSYDFRKDLMEYGRRAGIMKKLFTNNGFDIVYDKDEDEDIADGFYFTFSYPGFTGNQLLEKLIYVGISAITLDVTGSERTEGLRACVSQISEELMIKLEERLKLFHEQNS